MEQARQEKMQNVEIEEKRSAKKHKELFDLMYVRENSSR